MILLGCSGFAKAHAVYRSEFNTVEIQESFYNLIPLSRAEKWKREFPEDFVFTLKAPQLVTHLPASPTYRRLKKPLKKKELKKYGCFKNTPEVFAAWEEAAAFAHALGAKDVIFQCAKSFAPTEENKENLHCFFNRIPEHRFRIGLEVRGAWTPEDVKPYVDAGHCYHVIDPFVQEQYGGNGFIYYRLHGIGTYHYRYSEEERKALFEKISRADSGYLFFNNVYMWDDALIFKKMLGARSASLIR